MVRLLVLPLPRLKLKLGRRNPDPLPPGRLAGEADTAETESRPLRLRCRARPRVRPTTRRTQGCSWLQNCGLGREGVSIRGKMGVCVRERSVAILAGFRKRTTHSDVERKRWPRESRAGDRKELMFGFEGEKVSRDSKPKSSTRC